MTKVLSLLTLAVLAFSVMTGPAFAQFAKIPIVRLGVRPHVEPRMTPEHRPPPVVGRELDDVFGLESKRDLDLQKPGGRDAWKRDLLDPAPSGLR